jgi:hypothetical protein
MTKSKREKLHTPWQICASTDKKIEKIIGFGAQTVCTEQSPLWSQQIVPLFPLKLHVPLTRRIPQELEDHHELEILKHVLRFWKKITCAQQLNLSPVAHKTRRFSSNNRVAHKPRYNMVTYKSTSMWFACLTYCWISLQKHLQKKWHNRSCTPLPCFVQVSNNHLRPALQKHLQKKWHNRSSTKLSIGDTLANVETNNRDESAQKYYIQLVAMMFLL